MFLLVLNLDLVSQTRQRIPTRIRRCLFAGADCEVLVLTATRAEALAVWFAECSRGQGEQHLLAHDILEQKTALFIIPDFGLVGGNCVLAHHSVGLGGAEDEVEFAGEGLGDGLDAAGAKNLEVALVGGAEANVVDDGTRSALFAAVFDEEIGLTLYGKRGDLTNIGAVFEGAGGDGLVDLEGFVKELDRGNEHVFKGRTLVGWGQIGLVYMRGRRGVAPGSGWGSAGGKKDSLVLPQNDGSTATGG